MFGDCELCTTDRTDFSTRRKGDRMRLIGNVEVYCCTACHNLMVETLDGSDEYARVEQYERDIKTLGLRLTGRDNDAIESEFKTLYKEYHAFVRGPMRDRSKAVVANMCAAKVLS